MVSHRHRRDHRLRISFRRCLAFQHLHASADYHRVYPDDTDPAYGKEEHGIVHWMGLWCFSRPSSSLPRNYGRQHARLALRCKVHAPCVMHNCDHGLSRTPFKEVETMSVAGPGQTYLPTVMSSGPLAVFLFFILYSLFIFSVL